MKWLEMFQLAATLGSVQAVAEETGLSVSTVSQHLRSLESQLGVELFNHDRRPITLTPLGGVFLKNIDEALSLIRKAQSEITTADAGQTRILRLGLLEDFDSEIGPELAVHLAAGMPKCDFTHRTRPSHEILDMLRKKQIDIGVASRPHNGATELLEFPLLRDPFVLAIPQNCKTPPNEILRGKSELHFLRYSSAQHIHSQIEAQLRRLKIVLPNRFEIESNQTIMAMIAAGSGWAVTTPMSYMRARRFHAQVKLQPFPEKAFARSLSIFTTPETGETAQQIVGSALRTLFRKRALKPALEMMPWLQDSFDLS